MSGRIWPGALCYITPPWKVSEEIGRVVEAKRRSAFGETVSMRNGGISRHGMQIPGWLCDGPGDGFPCFVAEQCLSPILPPPGSESTEDATPVEHGIAHA